MLLMMLMNMRDLPETDETERPELRGYLFIVVIFVAILIDALLFAQVHANYIHDHGYDLRPRHPAVAKAALP
jgi:hypothetical protein